MSGKKPTVAGMIGQHVIVFLICVLFPGLVTGFAPATWITFQRTEDSVSCTTRTCVFFVVPYLTQRVDRVMEILEREEAATTRRQRKHGRETNKMVHVDGQGFLLIQGENNQMAEVSVSPASLANVVSKATAFMNSQSEKSTTIFTIANWKFGAIMGGVLTSFTILFVVGYTLGFLKFLFTSVKNILPKP